MSQAEFEMRKKLEDWKADSALIKKNYEIKPNPIVDNELMIAASCSFNLEKLSYPAEEIQVGHLFGTSTISRNVHIEHDIKRLNNFLNNMDNEMISRINNRIDELLRGSGNFLFDLM